LEAFTITLSEEENPRVGRATRPCSEAQVHALRWERCHGRARAHKERKELGRTTPALQCHSRGRGRACHVAGCKKPTHCHHTPIPASSQLLGRKAKAGRFDVAPSG